MTAVRIVLAALVVAVFALALAGLGQGGKPKGEGSDVTVSAAAVRAENARVAAAGAQARKGEKEFASEGCDDCHTIGAGRAHGTLGPRLDVTLRGDKPDDIVGDITQPAADIVDGYPAKLMPRDYATTIPRDDLQAIAVYIAAAAGPKKGGK